MSLPDDAVFPMLENDFTLGWKNIWRENYAGYSGGYGFHNCAVGTTNGAGAHNLQIFVLDEDGTVIHALPGFWHPEDLARELRFAKVLHRLYNDEQRDEESKRDMYLRLHLAEIRRQPAETFARSGWQDFDERTEMQRAKQENRDTVLLDEAGNAKGMKPMNVLVHERMVARPFKPFRKFDIATFVDYGQMFYDNNRRHEKGRKLPHK